MSTKKKTTSNSTISGLKAANVNNGKLIDSIKKSLDTDDDSSKNKGEVKNVLPLFQFVSDSVTVTGGNNLKLHSAKAIVFECVAKDYVEAFNMFKSDIKNKLNISSEEDVAYVLHDMFGEQIDIISTTARHHNVINGYRKKL